MEAHIAKIQMDVDYKCPNCYLHFRLSNSRIPQNKPLNHICPECDEHLTIPPLFKKTKNKRKVTTKKTVDPVIVELSIVELSISDELILEHTRTVELSTVELSVIDELSVIEVASSTVEFSTV